jgi:predicted nucleotidyltransferase
MDIEVVQQYNMRWTKENCPYPILEFKKKIVSHPIINKWDDFTDKDKYILQNIKNIIVSNIGDCRVSIFGSRIKGYWTEDSDYDIMIHKAISQEVLKDIKSIDYGVVVDIGFIPDGITQIVTSINID